MRILITLVTLVMLPLAACGGDDDEVDVADVTVATSSTTTPTTSTTTPTTTSTTTTTTSQGGEAAPPPTLADPVNRQGVERLTGTRIEMELDDFYFDPTFVQASPGTRVTVRLHNEGDARHTFTISDEGVDQVVEPGQEAEVQLTLPDQGPVVFACRFHAAQGMRGAFYFS